MSKRKVIIPAAFQVQFDKGCKLLETDPDKAQTHFRECARLSPEMWSALASKAMREGNKQEAIDGLCTALEFATEKDTRSYILCNLGWIFAHDGNIEMARKLFDMSLAEKPTPENWVNRGMVHSWEGEHDAALKYYNRAISKRPDLHPAHFAKSIIELSRGEYRTGLQNYESRFQAAECSAKKIQNGKPEWDGSPLNGRRLLIYTEQGLGDTIQMARYGAQLAPQCGWLGLACQKGLRRVLATMGCWDAIMEFGEELPDYDCHIPTMSLPRVLGVRPDNQSGAPYIPKPAAKQFGPGFHVGIAWKGSITHKMDYTRSIPLKRWQPILNVPGVTWHSLQVGLGEMEMDDIGTPINKHRLLDFYDTAKVLAGLDLVISVDTSVVHLAGAMGVPAWVMVSASPDWRWLLKGENTFWYDSLRLFRQSRLLGWDDVVSEIAAALSKLAHPQASVAAL